MNKEKIEAKIAQLEQERDQLKATIMAYEGAIQSNTQWLEELAKEEIKEE